MTDSALVRLFDRVLVINLPQRADRRRGIDAELRKVGLALDHPKVEVFAAIRPDHAAGFPSIGAHGAFRSHLGVMERMLESGKFGVEEDSSIASKYLYMAARDNFMSILKAAPRRKRLQQLHLLDDVKYCLTPDQSNVIPVLLGDRLVPLDH